MVGDLGLVQRNTRRSKTDRHSRNNSAGNEHSTVLCGALENRTDDPNPGGDHDSESPPQNVCQLGDQERPKEGACRHRSNDGTLSIGTRVAERPFICLIL